MARTSTDQVLAVVAQLSAMDERAQTRVHEWLSGHLVSLKLAKGAKRRGSEKESIVCGMKLNAVGHSTRQDEKMGGTA